MFITIINVATRINLKHVARAMVTMTSWLLKLWLPKQQRRRGTNMSACVRAVPAAAAL
jgi:hypothetical protein